MPRAPLTVVGGTKRRRYTRKQQATAIIAAELSTVAAAAKDQGIPESTLHYWLEEPRFAELRAKTREEAGAGYSVVAVLAMRRLVELVPTMEPRDLITLMGVATDKSQLLSGMATSRAETKDITDSFNDHERAALRRLFDEVLDETAVT